MTADAETEGLCLGAGIGTAVADREGGGIFLWGGTSSETVDSVAAPVEVGGSAAGAGAGGSGVGAVTSTTGFSGWGGVWRIILGLLGAAEVGAGAGARRTGALGANFLPDLSAHGREISHDIRRMQATGHFTY